MSSNTVAAWGSTDGSTVVSLCSCSKQELEQQCIEMLRTGIIHPGSSAFFAPLLLVKKNDGSWRFCIDYGALNNKANKDKFLIHQARPWLWKSPEVDTP
jgi:hypothetical protein